MDSVYQPPESELTTDNAYKGAIGWKIMLFLLLPLELWEQHDVFIVNEEGLPLWLLLWSLVTAGFLFGLGFARRFITRRFWQIFLPIMMVSDVYEISTLFTLEELSDLVLLTLFVVIFVPLVSLIWFSTFRYQQVFDRIER